MLTLAQADAPIWGFDVSGIGNPRQQVFDPLITDFAVRQILREGGLPFKEAFDLNLRCKAP
ncbi:hypothetical protein [Bauldia sp.]|uniref:hypothetical protein n=1 Tax=Bauldia sp. TaxID=2575872 RepID=UPI0025C5CE43|nr:hypothetical protein [Bauldia sp.]